MTKNAQHLRRSSDDNRSRRISARVREAIRIMVEEGLNRSEAAERAGLKDNSLYVALRRPEILALRRELMEVLRASAASKSIARVDKLASDAASEHVRLAANELLLGLAGHVPMKRTEGHVVHEVQRHVPGLIIVRHDSVRAAERAKSLEDNPVRLIDATPEPVEPRHRATR